MNSESDNRRIDRTEIILPPKRSLFRQLWIRRIPHILGIYLGISWGIIESMDWLVNRYILSPYLIDFALVLLLSMVPTVLLLAYYHGKPGPDEWTKVEKIGIPINALLSVAILFLVFGGKELGAITEKVKLTDEAGHTVERVVPKSGFCEKTAIFFFQNESNDSTLDWLQYGISLGMWFDLKQDIFIAPYSGYFFIDKVRKAGFMHGVGIPVALMQKLSFESNFKHFVFGAFTKKNGSFHIAAYIYDAKHGRPMAEHIFIGKNIFTLIDEITLWFKHNARMPERYINSTKDLPVSEITSSSLHAFQLYILANNAIDFDNDWNSAQDYLEQSVENDSTFARAFLQLALVNMELGQEENAENAIHMAMKYIYKLTERDKIGVRIKYYRIKNEMEKVISACRMRVELYPEDILAHHDLASTYRIQGIIDRAYLDKAISEYERILELDPKQHEYLLAIGAIYKEQGEFEKSLETYKKYQNKYPDDYRTFVALGELHYARENFEEAKSYYEKALLIEPESVLIIRKLIDIKRALRDFDAAIEQCSMALKICAIPRDSMDIYDVLVNLYETRGQIRKSLEYLKLSWSAAEKFMSPGELAIKRLQGVYGYIDIGETDTAFRLIEECKFHLPLTWKGHESTVYLRIYLLHINDAEQGEKFLKEFENHIGAGRIPLWKVHMNFFKGRLSELQGNYEEALRHYNDHIELRKMETVWRLGPCYRKLGKYDEAMHHLKKILETDPHNPKYNYEMALLCEDMNRISEAIHYLQISLDTWEKADSDYIPAVRVREKMADLDTIYRQISFP